MASCAGDGVELRRTFVVDIKHGGKPLPGVTIEVRGFGGEKSDSKLFSRVTASDGKVLIGKLPPGNYWLYAEFLGISAGSQCFHIASSTSRNAKKRITYEWGDLAPGVRQMAGRLVDSQPGHGGTSLWNLIHRVDVPIAHATMKLQDPTSAMVHNAESGVDGHFNFGQIPAGTYVLHIEGGTVANGRDYESTDLLITLSKKAKWETLLLSRRDPGGGSCGGTYLELRNPPS
jgi:hypothetical protein